MLDDYRGHYDEKEGATNISTRLLPATLDELKKGERRVLYTATMHASERHRQKRIAYLQERIAYWKKGLRSRFTNAYDPYEIKSYRKSLACLKPEGYTLSRIALVRATARGWNVADGYNADGRPWDWLYADYYQTPWPLPKR
jgi:hypothetical protein